MVIDEKFKSLVEAVVYIALHAKPNAVRGTEICAAQKLPERYLEISLQNLVHEGILKSVRGPKGGYILAKERRNISLADIYFAAAEGEVEKKKKRVSKFAKSVVEPILKNMEDEMLETLREISVEELVTFSYAAGIQRAEDLNSEFVI